ncbi:MAG: copper resistance protein NlpE N-terminal domain-containing protein [Saprospiraceae bacterium]
MVAAVVTITVFMSSCKAQKIAPEPWYSETNTNGDSVLAVYESRIPCPDCERLKFALVIYGNTRTGLPSTYTMARVYVGKNNDRLTNSGNIIVKQGTSMDSTHIVYFLSTGAPKAYQLFWKVTKDILFILDDNLTPRVGDAGQGYALNRTR